MSETKTNMDNNIISAVKAIRCIKITPESTIKSIKDEFYEICRTNGIKQGTPAINDEGKIVGTSIYTPEWSICKDVLKTSFESHLSLMDLLDEIPEDLKM